jgi:hypothetical protein
MFKRALASSSDAVEAGTASATIGEIFVAIYDELLTEPSESRLQYSLGAYLHDRLAEKLEGKVAYYAHPKDVVRLRNQLGALDLVEAFGGTSSGGMLKSHHTFIAWRPTEKGRRYAVGKKALLKGGPVIPAAG